MRGWLNDVRSYVPPVAIGEKMRGATIATVLRSKKEGIKTGDVVLAPVFTPAQTSCFKAYFGCSQRDGANMPSFHK